MSTKTKYLLQGAFFLILGLLCLFAYFNGKSETMKRFTGAGVLFSIFIGLIFIKNAFRK